MRRLATFLSIFGLFLLFSGYKKDNPSDAKNQALLSLLVQGLQQMHYDPLKIDDDFSEKVFTLYLKRIDFGKRFLLRSDSVGLAKYRHAIDDQVNNGTFEFFNQSSELITQRIKEAETYYKDYLSKPFDFTTEETVQLDPDKMSFAADQKALQENWRKYLKYEVLTSMAAQLDIQENAKTKKDTTIKQKSLEILESEARKRELDTHNDWFHRLNQLEEGDRVSVYLNTISNVYDPHTEYFAPKEKEDFDINMSGQLEGIGATLQEKDGYIKVASIVPGSASWRQGELKAGDIILKVGQGKDEPVDIVDMRLDKAVSLIRGKKGTEVRLTVKKPDGSISVIPIIRDVVIIEETFAQSALIDKNIGYIKLPGFYADFSKRDGRRSAEDVKTEIEKLKSEGAKSIVLDLRSNGGGSLDDVVKMFGLFIEKGPVVQVMEKGSAPDVLEDKDPSVQFDGELVVLVNSQSASASEIFAAAVQDYKRGIIIGSPSTFGKGTVQRFFDLDDFAPPVYEAYKPMGSVKITLQKFYRVNGESTQLRGVNSDIIVPDMYGYIPIGEKEEEYAMKWDKTIPSKYAEWKNGSMARDLIVKEANERIKKNANFNLIDEQAQVVKKDRDQAASTLNLNKFIAEQKAKKERNKRFEQLGKEIAGFEVKPLKADESKVGKDDVKRKKQDEFVNSLKKDLYVYEAVQVLHNVKYK
jgi:carboxyl-terminal processing protease